MKGLSLVNAGSLLRGTIDAPTMLIQPAPTEKRNTALLKPHNAASTFKRVSQSVPFAHFAGRLRNASTVMLSINVLTTSVDSSSNAWRSGKSSSKTPELICFAATRQQAESGMSGSRSASRLRMMCRRRQWPSGASGRSRHMSCTVMWSANSTSICALSNAAAVPLVGFDGVSTSIGL